MQPLEQKESIIAKQQSIERRPVVLMPCVSLHFLPVLQAVQDLGGYVICVDNDPDALCHKLADESHIISADDLDTILELAQKRGVSRAIATSETSVHVVAYVAEKMGLPVGISYENAIRATHKDAMRDCFATHNVPIPQYVVCRDYLTFETAIDSFDGYCVVKPSDNASSRGVLLLDCKEDVESLEDLYETTRRYSSTGTVLVEERVDGPEVSVESITINGLSTIVTITDKMTTPPPFCAEIGHTEPSRLPADTQEAIRQATLQAISAIGLENGPSHTEVKVGKTGVKVIEIGVRPGGDFITAKLVPLSTGIDFHRATAEIGMGIAPHIKRTTDRGAAIRFVSAPVPGVISGIHIDERLNKISGLLEFVQYRHVGDEVHATLSNNDHVGHVLCVGKTAGEAACLADEALGYIDVRVNSR